MSWRRAPAFWQSEGLPARLLRPVSCLVAMAARRRWRAGRQQRVPVPVICVGNLVAGGAGKTPVALDILQRLTRAGRRPFALTRGYGGREAGPLLVNPEEQDWRAVGDEALLLAKAAPTVVARDRVAGAELAVARGADVIVMDDGFQNPSLHKDLALLVVDGGYGLGNGMVMPSGPLREPAEDAFARAGALVMIGEDSTRLASRLPRDLTLLRADLAPPTESPTVAGRRFIAFAGIGRPRKFFDSLRAAGATLVSAVGFPDHHPYRESELTLILEKAEALDATPITTEKDLVRIPAPYAGRVESFPVELRWRENGKLWDLLEELLDHD